MFLIIADVCVICQQNNKPYEAILRKCSELFKSIVCLSDLIFNIKTSVYTAQLEMQSSEILFPYNLEVYQIDYISFYLERLQYLDKNQFLFHARLLFFLNLKYTWSAQHWYNFLIVGISLVPMLNFLLKYYVQSGIWSTYSFSVHQSRIQIQLQNDRLENNTPLKAKYCTHYKLINVKLWNDR